MSFFFFFYLRSNQRPFLVFPITIGFPPLDLFLPECGTDLHFPFGEDCPSARRRVAHIFRTGQSGSVRSRSHFQVGSPFLKSIIKLTIDKDANHFCRILTLVYLPAFNMGLLLAPGTFTCSLIN